MLHSQTRSKQFRRRTQYWDAQNTNYTIHNQTDFIHTFSELPTIQENPDVTVRVEPGRLPNPPPITVGSVTTRDPSTTVDGKLPRNTFYRCGDGKLALGDRIYGRHWNVKTPRPNAFHRQKSEEDIYRGMRDVSIKQKERMGAGRNVRVRARQMFRSRSDEKVFTKKSMRKKGSKKHAGSIKAMSTLNDCKLGKTGSFPACKESHDIEYPMDFDEGMIGNGPSIVRGGSSEYMFLNKKKKKSSKKAKMPGGETPGLDNNDKCQSTEAQADRKIPPRLSSPRADEPVIGSHGIIVTDYGPPARPIVITADQYAHDFDKQTYKLKQQKHIMPKCLTSAVQGISMEADWNLMWEGAKKCLQVAWEWTQCQSYAVMKHIEHVKKVLMDDSIKKANEELLNSDGSNMSSGLGKECVYFRRGTQRAS